MAARKKAARKKAGASAPTSALATRNANSMSAVSDSMAEFLAKYTAQDQAAAQMESAGFPFISTKAGMLRFENEQLPNPLRVVILGAVRVNQYYEGDFDPENPAGPVCFAVNTDSDESTMGPPDTLATAVSSQCEGCPMNAFGSGGRTGKGKACRNSMRVALLPYDNVKDFGKAAGARLSIPPMSLKHFGPFAKKVVEGLGRPLFSVVTELTATPDDKSQFVLSFDIAEPINDEATLVALAGRVDGDGKASLESLPQAPTEADGARPPRSGGKQRVAVQPRAAKKKAARKRRAG